MQPGHNLAPQNRTLHPARIVKNLNPLGRYKPVKLFGTSGIRGLYPTQVNEDLFLKVGAALGTMFDGVAVGRDVRLSGLPLQLAFMAGITSTGGDAYDAGVVTTPTVAHLAASLGCGGIITASHNPPEYNGLKLWSPTGMAFDEALQSRVEEAMEGFSGGGWDEVGQVHRYEGALRDHKEKILATVNSTDVRVAVDCGNGATSYLTPLVLREMGCDVRALHCQPDGTFPGRGPEPTEDSLRDLAARVRRAGCRVGVAHDGDGDRMVAVDEEGAWVKGEKLLVLFARALGAHRVVVPVDASMALEDVLGKDRVVRTRVGDVYVAEAIQDAQADLGGEASGTWIFPEFSLCPDGVYAAAYLCSLLQNETIGDHVADVPDYPILRGSLTYSRSEALERVGRELESLDVEEVSRLDGWRLDFGDGWALVRPSGTEPKIRITSEAREEERAREIYGALHSKVSRAIG